MNISELIKLALSEDMPRGDITTDNLPLNAQAGAARLLAKEDLVLSGKGVFSGVMAETDANIEIKWHFNDGDFIWAQQTVATLVGPLKSLLKAERVALNFLGHLSGVATLTRCFVRQIEGTGCRILDTRKTTPLMRDLEKSAVRHGQGHNHRMNLSDGIIIKDNHIRAMGTLSRAVNHLRQAQNLPLEVECSTIAEVEEAVKAKVDRILLDNMNDETLRQALARIPSSIKTEASGNMSLERVKSVANLGVQAISVGALTHSAPCADFSLMFSWPEDNST